MFDVVNQPIKEIILIYIMFGGACIVTFPVTKLITNALEKGGAKWR